jgi:HPt (histidine-containing phosphotransfer) domain-containing protein
MLKDTTVAAGTRHRSEFADDPDMREIVRVFVGDMPAKVREVRACWERGDLDRLMRLAHQLKGAAAGYGFPNISDAATSLEASLRTIVGRGEAVPLPQVQAEYTRLIELCLSADPA